MAISNDVLSQTLGAIHDEVSFALTQTTPFLQVSRQLGKIHHIGKNSSQSGSYRLRIPVEVAESSRTTSVSGTGYETLDLSVQDATRSAEYNWAHLVRPVIISEKDKLENGGDAGVCDFAETRYRGAMQGLMRQINDYIIGAQNPQNIQDLTNLGTLNGMATGGINTGFLEAVLPYRRGGTQVNTVGGLSKSVYKAVPGWQNQFGDAAGNCAANLENEMHAIETYASLCRDMAKDAQIFHAVLLHPLTYLLYTKTQQSVKRYLNTKEYDAGGAVLQFGSAPVYADPSFITNAGANIGADGLKLSGYFLNLDQIQLAIHDERDFAFGPFEDMIVQTASRANITFSGGLIAKSLGGSGILVDALA